MSSVFPYKSHILLLLLLTSVFCGSNSLSARAETESQFELHRGDRVVFYGDSITAQRLYTRYVEESVIARYPELQISFFNAGVSGDKVTGGSAGDAATRVVRDVISVHPTVIFVMLGMNDGRYIVGKPEVVKDYTSGYKDLLSKIRQGAPTARLYLLKPSPYDEYAHQGGIYGYDKVLGEFGLVVGSLASEFHAKVIDLHDPVVEALRRAALADPVLGGGLLPDRIHPSSQGHWLLTAALLQGLKFNGVVSSTVIDSRDGRIKGSVHVSISNLHTSGNELVWDSLEDALPLPIESADSVMTFLKRTAEFDILNQERLQIVSLALGSYRVSIDGELIGIFTTEELAEGVNLANFDTPMLAQAKSIDWAADDRGKAAAAAFQLITQNSSSEGSGIALSELTRLQEHFFSVEQERARPKSHHFTVSPISQEQQTADKLGNHNRMR